MIRGRESHVKKHVLATLLGGLCRLGFIRILPVQSSSNWTDLNCTPLQVAFKLLFVLFIKQICVAFPWVKVTKRDTGHNDEAEPLAEFE